MRPFRGNAIMSMIAVAATMICFPLPSAAQTAPTLVGTIEINGSSTVRNWSCKTTEITSELKASPEYASQVFSGKKIVEGLFVAAAVDKISCGNGTMEGHLRKALKAPENPSITFRLKEYTISPLNPESASVIATGELTIAGVTKSVEITARVTLSPDKSVKIQGEKELLMTDFGVKPPTLMLGTLKVRDAIKIRIDLHTQSPQ